MKKILNIFALMGVILLVFGLALLDGYNHKYNPFADECYGYSDSYDTFLEGEGYDINYACPNAETQVECNANLTKMSAYYYKGKMYRCEYGKWIDGVK